MPAERPLSKRPLSANRTAARAIAVTAEQEGRRRMIGLAFNCAAASFLLAVLAVSFAVLS